MKWVIEFTLAASLAAAAAEPVTDFTLDEHTLFKVPVSQTRVTTCMFPGAISAIDAAGMTLDGTTPGFFQLAYLPTNAFFSLRALTNGASANLNVIFKRKVYVIEVTESRDPTFSVIFREPLQPIPLSATAGAPDGPRPTLTQLLGLIQKAKSYDILHQHYPAVLAGATRVQLAQTNEYDTFRIRLKTVTRFEAEDALVFETELTSKTGQRVRYRPESIAVRVGQNLYHAAISDAGGVIYDNFSPTMTFVIVGQADGQRNDLSPTNNFVVLLAPYPRD